MTFPKKAPKTWAVLASRIGVIIVVLAYVLLVLISVYLGDSTLFQNAGAVGVAAVLSAFALFRREGERQVAFENFSISVAVADMMVLRAFANNPEGKEDFEKAGEVVKQSLQNYDDTQQKSDSLLFWEVLLSVVFTLQWGFGQMIWDKLNAAH
ncbi:hypothetical protein [Marivita sp.]|uniref:hypothetical protein n=1 Tax=Marivita sp. TaxID=2003365 RepID=UPI003F72E6FD